MYEIEVGDTVRHKTQIVNGGMTMNVLKVTEDKALCDHLEGPEAINKQTWFNISDLEIVHKVQK